MTTTQLLLLLLLVIVVVIAVVWLMRRGAGQKEAARVEAEVMRGRAAEVGASLSGQQAFAEQAEERAAVVRAEAEQRAAEAARLEEEASAHRAAAGETQREYETQMRRADDVDPDVTESTFAPAAEESSAAEGDPDPATDAPANHHRRGRRPPHPRRASGRPRPGGDRGLVVLAGRPVPAATGAAVAGASSQGRPDEDTGSGTDADSERVASATDFRDDVTPEGERPGDVSAGAAAGTTASMSDDTREQGLTDTDLSRDVESPSGEWGGPPRDERGALGGDERHHGRRPR